MLHRFYPAAIEAISWRPEKSFWRPKIKLDGSKQMGLEGKQETAVL